MTLLSKLLSHYIVLLSFCILFYFPYVPFVFLFLYGLFFLFLYSVRNVFVFAFHVTCAVDTLN